HGKQVYSVSGDFLMLNLTIIFRIPIKKTIFKRNSGMSPYFSVQFQEYDKFEEVIDKMGKVNVLEHPLIQHKLTYIRDKRTGTKEFRELVDEVAMLMAFEITRNLPVQETTVETPVMETKASVLAGKKIGLIPILRAGLGMVDG